MKYTLLLTLLLSGCASIEDDFVFNGSSPSAIESDIHHVMNCLSRKEKKAFIQAVYAIQKDNSDTLSRLLADPTFSSADFVHLSKKMHGMTYAQVLAYVKSQPSDSQAIID